MVCECGATIREGARFCGKCGRPVVMAEAAGVAEAVQNTVNEGVQAAEGYVQQAAAPVQPFAAEAQPYANPAYPPVQPVQPYGNQAYPPEQPAQPYGNQAYQPAQPYGNQAYQPAQPYGNQGYQPEQPYGNPPPMTNPDGTPVVPPPYPWEKAAKVKKEKAPKPPKEPREKKPLKLNKRLLQYAAMGLGLVLLVLGIIGLVSGKGGSAGSEGVITSAVKQSALNDLPNGSGKTTLEKGLQAFDNLFGGVTDALGTVANGVPGDVGKIAKNVASAGETVTGGSSGGFLNTMGWPFTIAGAVLLLGGGAWFFLDSKKNKKAAVAA